MRSIGWSRQAGMLVLTLLVFMCGMVSAQEDDYYEILGLQDEREEASDQEIKRRFRKLSKKYHPDHNPDARETYVKVQRAYEVLSTRKKRKIYDMKGEEGLKQLEESEKNPNRGQHMDPFAQMFGMGGGNSDGEGSDGSFTFTTTSSISSLNDGWSSGDDTPPSRDDTVHDMPIWTTLVLYLLRCSSPPHAVPYT